MHPVPRVSSVIYVDSFDIDWTNPHPSALHHPHEFVYASHLMRPGWLLVVDDDAGTWWGEGMYTRDHLD